MADNYIEKQQEQYEARKAAWERAKKLGKKKTTSATTPRSTSSGEKKSNPT